MAKNNNFLNFPAEFISQLIFAAFLILILTLTGTSLSFSIFLGIIGGLTLGWITTASKNNPKPQSIASSEGIDAALKYWLFFLLGFSLLGYPAPISILLGGIAALGGGWIIAWWGSKEETRTQLPAETTEDVAAEQPSERSTRQQKRRVTRRFRRTAAGGINFKFWER
ncbi:hypothetical protein [Calothrix sp. PCC 7507]|uniref:hypothetical protein n=1 Tax=Calothrix sp. PCC 7507 TaxID=99598 RepID=UPI00029F0E66|nr:hypothetical protein [Calothrix sp. PCC 7507]AFY34010.1 hypothetical protein Cal7507_3618 [Calothrix sp. PCC 7507]